MKRIIDGKENIFRKHEADRVTEIHKATSLAYFEFYQLLEISVNELKK